MPFHSATPVSSHFTNRRDGSSPARCESSPFPKPALSQRPQRPPERAPVFPVGRNENLFEPSPALIEAVNRRLRDMEIARHRRIEQAFEALFNAALFRAAIPGNTIPPIASNLAQSPPYHSFEIQAVKHPQICPVVPASAVFILRHGSADTNRHCGYQLLLTYRIPFDAQL